MAMAAKERVVVNGFRWLSPIVALDLGYFSHQRNYNIWQKLQIRRDLLPSAGRPTINSVEVSG